MPLTDSEKQQRLDFAIEAARKAGELILGYYQTDDLEVDNKTDDSPVTIADRNGEKLIREQIEATFPDDGICGEEFPEKKSANGLRWILDPIDGTKSFVHGVGLFGTLIGLEEIESKNLPLGVCSFPALNEIAYAAQGLGAYFQIGDAEPKRATASAIDKISDATFCYTDVTGFHKVNKSHVFNTLAEQAWLVRGWGDCYGHILVATGRAEFMIDHAIAPWDIAAIKPIVEEAGGHLTDWSGASTIYGGNSVSLAPGIKDAVLEILRS